MEPETEIDPSTGLPELPEGMWWRVGDISRKYASGGWSRGGDYVPGVAIMKFVEERKEKRVPIFGTKWWNKSIVVRHESEFHTKKTEKIVDAATFTGHAAYEKKEIPSIGVSAGSSSGGGMATRWFYEIPVTPEGTLWLAEKLNRRRKYWEERLRIEQEEKKVRQALYGDYPPKTLAK